MAWLHPPDQYCAQLLISPFDHILLCRQAVAMLNLLDISEQVEIQAALLSLSEGQLHLVSDMLPVVSRYLSWQVGTCVTS